MSSDLVNSEPRPGQHGVSNEGSSWHGLSELHKAAVASANDVRILLLNGADVTVRTNYGETPLHYACHSGNWGGVFQLLLFGANLYDVDHGGRMCVHHAARSGCLLTFQYLEFLGMNAWLRDHKGRTALHIAVEHGHFELIKYLISQEDADLRVRDNKHKTPMHNAVLQSNRVLCWLLESTSNETLLEDQDQDGKTPIDYAISTGNLVLIKSLRRWSGVHKKSGKLNVPMISWFTALITPSTSTLCIALIVWLFESRVLITILSLVVFILAYFYSMRPHRMWHVSREPNPGLCGWFFGSVIISLLIYYVLILPEIWPDYLFTLLSVLMLLMFVKSIKNVYGDPGKSTKSRTDHDGHPMGIINVVSAGISSQEYCTRCKTVYPERTKHCRLCDCCYTGLDHHCLFLMTCVAKNNHGAFLFMVFFVFIAQVSYVRGAIIYLWSLSDIYHELSYLSVLGMVPLISVYLFVNVLGLWWTLSLLLYQIKVISEGGTTCFLPNGELRTRIDCLHATGTIGELTCTQRIRYMKAFIQTYYLPHYGKPSDDKPQII